MYAVNVNNSNKTLIFNNPSSTWSSDVLSLYSQYTIQSILFQDIFFSFSTDFMASWREYVMSRNILVKNITILQIAQNIEGSKISVYKYLIVTSKKVNIKCILNHASIMNQLNPWFSDISCGQGGTPYRAIPYCLCHTELSKQNDSKFTNYQEVI